MKLFFIVLVSPVTERAFISISYYFANALTKTLTVGLKFCLALLTENLSPVQPLFYCHY